MPKVTVTTFTKRRNGRTYSASVRTPGDEGTCPRALKVWTDAGFIVESVTVEVVPDLDFPTPE